MATTTFDPASVRQSNLLELLDVVPGAIVSKPLIATADFRMVLFALDAGQQLTEHATPMLAIVHVLDGHLRFRVAGAEHELAPDDCLTLPPSAPHDVVAESPSRMLLTMVRTA